MKRLKKIKIKKIWIILTIINIAMLIAYTILTACSNSLAHSLNDQLIVSKWSPDSNQYSQRSEERRVGKEC